MSPATPSLPPEADAAMRRGNKIEAIKITREQLGIGLKEAKDLCDAWSPADPVASGDFIAPAFAGAHHAPAPVAADAFVFPAEAEDALRAGNRIEAIKIVRERTGWGLKECKEAVEFHETANPHLAPAPACDTGDCGARPLVLALLALGLIAAAVYFSGVLY